jgi:hypothetical protein
MRRVVQGSGHIRGAVTTGRVRVWFQAGRLLYKLHHEVNMMRFEI